MFLFEMIGVSSCEKSKLVEQFALWWAQNITLINNDEIYNIIWPQWLIVEDIYDLQIRYFEIIYSAYFRYFDINGSFQ